MNLKQAFLVALGTGALAVPAAAIAKPPGTTGMDTVMATGTAAIPR